MFLATSLSRLEQSFVEFLRSLLENSTLKEWHIVAFDLDKVRLKLCLTVIYKRLNEGALLHKLT